MTARVLTLYLFAQIYVFPHAISLGNGEFYTIDDSVGYGRRFDGVGAISGGGATSKLLVNYPAKQRDEVLDYLFKPNFGASLHIFKVEIGGDSQSSDGTESSHMHEPWDENYNRGYEWWMMKEAKKRNPKIKLYGLPWGWPGWLGDKKWWPFVNPNRTADYIVRWIQGAKKYHGLEIDLIGIWNEKPYDVAYIKALRITLDERNLHNTKIVAADLIGSDSWDIVTDMMKDPALNRSVDFVGGHYTGAYTTSAAQRCGKPLWSTEDWSFSNDELGAGCMARLLNKNYIQGYMTSLIAWNILYAYYAFLDYPARSLMTSQQPWSGHYVVNPPIWATAHTTQFTEIGWHYLKHDFGVGYLDNGGSYVTYISPDKKNYTIVIETMDTAKNDFCVRPPEVKRKVSPQNVTLQLYGSLGSRDKLNLWHTKLGLGKEPSVFFELSTVQVINGEINLSLDVNSIYTITTLTSGLKGATSVLPSKPFPIPYHENFESYDEEAEAFNLAQQVGVFEVRQTNSVDHGKVMRQVMINAPIFWCPELQSFPLTVIGNHDWSDVHARADVMVPAVNGTWGVFLAARVAHGGCTTVLTRGLFFFLHVDRQTYQLATDLAATQDVKTGAFSSEPQTWYSLGLTIKGNHTIATIDGKVIFDGDISGPTANGFVGLGTTNFGLANYDNLDISHPANS